MIEKLTSLRTLDEEYRSDIQRYWATWCIQDIIAYFDGKTQAILQRYGPGPRVHYHTGLIDDPPLPTASAHVLRGQLVVAQEHMLYHAAKKWDASSALSGDVLDVGCGLGGGAIFWAQEFGARVTAVTCVPSHVDLVARFALEVGIQSQVQPLLGNAVEIPGENRFDAAVAIDSSGYIPRRTWFHRLSALLRPGGRVFIIDCFLERPDNDNREMFNRYWHTRIGTIDEYLTAAHAAGLRSRSVENVSHRTVHFWTTTLALMQAEARENELSHAEVARQQASLRAHALVRQGLIEGSFCYALMSFSKCP